MEVIEYIIKVGEELNTPAGYLSLGVLLLLVIVSAWKIKNENLQATK